MQFGVNDADFCEYVLQIECNGGRQFVAEETEPCVPTVSVCYPKDKAIASIRAKLNRDYQEICLEMREELVLGSVSGVTSGGKGGLADAAGITDFIGVIRTGRETTQREEVRHVCDGAPV